MEIIPVIDLSAGQVVRAVRGERSQYRPIQSALCGSSEPTVVAGMLIERCGACKLYVADLDALQGGVPQTAAIGALLDALPEVELWLDGGFVDADDARSRCARLAERVTPVFGSESLRSTGDAERCFDDPTRAILSLDRRGDAPIDPAHCWTSERWWPDRVIVMTLDRVGAFAGPDLATFDAVRERAGRRALIGAGGIRDERDLAAAASAGATAWLVASALHDLRISSPFVA